MMSYSRIYIKIYFAELEKCLTVQPGFQEKCLDPLTPQCQSVSVMLFTVKPMPSKY